MIYPFGAGCARKRRQSARTTRLPRFRGFAVNVGNAWTIKQLIGRRYDDPIKAMVPYHIVPRGNGDAWVEVRGKNTTEPDQRVHPHHRMKENRRSRR
jgi:hypothetical protein